MIPHSYIHIYTYLCTYISYLSFPVCMHTYIHTFAIDHNSIQRRTVSLLLLFLSSHCRHLTSALCSRNPSHSENWDDTESDEELLLERAFHLVSHFDTGIHPFGGTDRLFSWFREKLVAESFLYSNSDSPVVFSITCPRSFSYSRFRWRELHRSVCGETNPIATPFIGNSDAVGDDKICRSISLPSLSTNGLAVGSHAGVHSSNSTVYEPVGASGSRKPRTRTTSSGHSTQPASCFCNVQELQGWQNTDPDGVTATFGSSSILLESGGDSFRIGVL